jgi:uncharacterized repeat protein (TIGR03803 family)
MTNAPGNRGLTAVIATAILMMLVTAIALQAQTLTTLHTFDLSTDGASPDGTLLQGIDGNLYGTTAGEEGSGTYNSGTVFQITPSGALTTLHIFCSLSACADGSDPLGGVLQGPDGNFYGTTNSGGADNFGSVFKITPTGTLTTIYSFCPGSNCADGYSSYGTLLQAVNGPFYGTTYYGGAYGRGTVFSVSPGGTLTALYSFGAQSGDGGYPAAGLIQATNGNFYGTTTAYQGPGTIFEITSSGAFTTIHKFCPHAGCADGRIPNGLVQSTDGKLYGTTASGGDSSSCYEGCGTVFRMSPSGTFTRLYSFCSQAGCTDGSTPASLIQATDGNFYGTTDGGGAGNHGTIFKITPGGTLTTVYSFCSESGCADGSRPEGLVQDTDGTFYGTTNNGGGNGCEGAGCGTVFNLLMGLAPFVETKPSYGKVGSNLKILGTNLTGATSVTFNGIPATFTLESPAAISTTVPAGATTGSVQVVTPGGTLTSNVNFKVIP